MPRSPRDGYPRALALAVLAVGSPLLLAAFWLGGPVGTAVAALLVGLLPAALFVLGAGSKLHRLRRRLAFWVLLLALSGGVLAVYGTASTDLAEVWLGGFPLPTALLIYGVGLGLLIATGAFYAAVFDRLGIDREELERLERIASRPADPDEAGE